MERATHDPGPEAVEIGRVAGLYRQVWRHVRNVCIYPALYIVVAPVFIANHLLGRVWTDVSIGQTFRDTEPLAALAMLFAPPTSLIAWLAIGTYRGLGLRVAIGVGWALFLLATFTDSLIHDLGVLIGRIPAGNSKFKGDFDGSANRVIGMIWIVWGLVTLVSGLAVIYAMTSLGFRRLIGGERTPVAAIRRFAAVVRQQRQTYRAYDFRRLPWLLAAAAAAVGFAYATHWLQSRTKRALFPELTYRTFEDSVAILRDHLGKALMAVGMELVALLAATTFAYLVLRAGWRKVRLSALAVLGQQSYRPTVYLRSFRDEDADLVPSSLAMRLQLRRVRLEEAVVGMLAGLGPAVAIGQPGERSPRLGALRAYYPNEAWQDAVQKWVGTSRLIVVTAGSSPSVLWELQHLAANGLMDRVLMIVPPDLDIAARKARWAAVSETFAGTPWQARLQAIDCSRTLCVVFAGERRIATFDGDCRHQSDYELAVQLAAVELLGRAA